MNSFNAITLDLDRHNKSEFRIFPAGLFTTYDGRTDDTGGWYADQYALAKVLAEREDYVLIDYDHDSITCTGMHGLPPAAGWVKKFEARADGLWAVAVEWTKKASDMIDSLEARYISPAFIRSSPDAPDIVSIDSIGLVNKPAIKGLTRLAKNEFNTTEKPIMTEEIETETTAVKVDDLVEAATELAIAEAVEGALASIADKSDAETDTDSTQGSKFSTIDDALEDIKKSLLSLSESMDLVMTKLEAPDAQVETSVKAATFNIEQQDVDLTATSNGGGKLTPEQLNICKRFNLTEAEFLKHVK